MRRHRLTPTDLHVPPMKRYPRTPPRLEWIFPDSPVFFITFCAYRRHRLLANRAVHLAFQRFALSAYRDYNVAVERYVIMPDHIHLFVCGPDDFLLGRWIGALKQALAKAITNHSARSPIWQRGFFDHILRSNESYSEKWEYVRDNPKRAGLISNGEEWPYAGEIVAIEHDL